MDRRRENSNKRGVRRCCRVFGGTSGPEEGMMRAVGRCFGFVVTSKKSAYISSLYVPSGKGRGMEAELTGSSTSVSVSPAHGWPGAVVMLLGPFGAGPGPPNKRLRKLVLDLVLAPAECFELELEAREVYIMLLSSPRSSPLSSACIRCG